jgi:hypothetical protein
VTSADKKCKRVEEALKRGQVVGGGSTSGTLSFSISESKKLGPFLFVILGPLLSLLLQNFDNVCNVFIPFFLIFF